MKNDTQEMLKKIVEKLETCADEVIVSIFAEENDDHYGIHCSGMSEGYENSAEIEKQIAAEYGFSLDDDATPLKVGDKVRIISNDEDLGFPVGTIGVIVSDKSNDPIYRKPYLVEANGKRWRYKGDALEVVARKVMPTMDDLADSLKGSGCEDLAGAVLRGKDQLQAKLKSRKV